MTWVLLGAVVLLFVVVFLLAGACTELFRDIRQLQEAVGIVDKPTPVQLPVAGSAPSAHGLPAGLDLAEAAVVLILSDRCGTCSSLVMKLEGSVPESLTLLIEASDRSRGQQWLERTGALQFGERVLFDSGGALALGLGIPTTPCAVVIRDGLLTEAMTVPSSRQLAVLLGSPVVKGAAQLNSRAGERIG